MTAETKAAVVEKLNEASRILIDAQIILLKDEKSFHGRHDSVAALGAPLAAAWARIEDAESAVLYAHRGLDEINA